MSRGRPRDPHYYVVNTFDITDTLVAAQEFNAGHQTPRPGTAPAVPFPAMPQSQPRKPFLR